MSVLTVLFSIVYVFYPSTRPQSFQNNVCPNVDLLFDLFHPVQQQFKELKELQLVLTVNEVLNCCTFCFLFCFVVLFLCLKEDIALSCKFCDASERCKKDVRTERRRAAGSASISQTFIALSIMVGKSETFQDILDAIDDDSDLCYSIYLSFFQWRFHRCPSKPTSVECPDGHCGFLLCQCVSWHDITSLIVVLCCRSSSHSLVFCLSKRKMSGWIRWLMMMAKVVDRCGRYGTFSGPVFSFLTVNPRLEEVT
mmetsp:Transcript_55008/g.133604  ORF Transcript_55008/g.133604 Transcript_55008/m.133604 type:complete len:253 (+) Transcript_55008:708-1466(+)